MNRFVAAVMLTAATGCTMCPDPYDYSGPVPNGSAPQNDFRARSNGIIPIGAQPTPWPQIVGRQSGTPSSQDVAAMGDGRMPELVAEALAADPASGSGPEDDASIAVAHVVAEEAGAAESDAGTAVPVGVAETEVAAADAEPAIPGGPATEPEGEAVAGVLPPLQPVAEIPVGPLPRETPGWRPRSQQ